MGGIGDDYYPNCSVDGECLDDQLREIVATNERIEERLYRLDAYVQILINLSVGSNGYMDKLLEKLLKEFNIEVKEIDGEKDSNRGPAGGRQDNPR